MPTDLLTDLAQSPWALVAMFALVLADAFLVLIPGEIAVTALGALAVSAGNPPLAAVIAVAGLAAFGGDASLYAIGRRVGLERWRWIRRPRVAGAFAWASGRLARGTASIVFTARFIPFARLAVNLTAGASRIPAPRYLALTGAAALGWAAYQAVLGAVVAALVPGGPVVAVIISIVIAIALGVAIDLVVARRARDRPPS